MSKNKLKKGFLAEGMLDTLFKGILGTYFGSKMIDGYSRKMAAKDPKVQKHLKNVKKALDDFDAIMTKYAEK
tara:strand:+ start:77 stop:292 length:216 start_codon:yes stop_codon:yes gene_type:complete